MFVGGGGSVGYGFLVAVGGIQVGVSVGVSVGVREGSNVLLGSGLGVLDW